MNWLLGKWTRFWRAFGSAWRVLRFAKTNNDWTQDDAKVLASFLGSGTGLKLQQRIVDEIVAESQTANAEGGDAFRSGMVHGKKELWVALGVLTSAGVTPQEDTQHDSYY